jgi:hypothetical protein
MVYEVPRDRHVGNNEPWRFRCPNCRRTEWCIQRRVNGVQDHSEAMERPSSPLYCEGCSTPLDGLYDAKQGTVIEYGAPNAPTRLQRPTTANL